MFVFFSFSVCVLFFSGLSLAGVGVRVKKIGPVSAKVYAAGLYVNRGAATGI